MHKPFFCAATFLHHLYDNGVEHLFISPGSRSTPLTLAASLHPHLQSTVVLDERSAAFLALGASKQSGRPSVLICTSGTAASNYFPAVTEAKESGVPLIVITADRPPNLRQIGSSQTIDQVKLYGDQAFFFYDTGETENDESDQRRLIYLAKQAVEKSILHGGAAHINMPFRKPLEPDQTDLDWALDMFAKNVTRTFPPFESSCQEIHLSESLVSLINRSERPLIIAGPSNPFQTPSDHLRKLHQIISAPIIAEPGCQLIDRDSLKVYLRYEQFLRNKETRKELSPDLIIRFGDQPFTRSILSAMEEWRDVPTVHFSTRAADQDHAMSVDYKILCRNSDSINLQEITSRSFENWHSSWKRAEQHSSKALMHLLDTATELTDGHIFSHLSNQLNENWNTMISNSFPPRDMALFGSPFGHHVVNRGAAGIDGITSTAIGVQIASKRKTCAILGDLAFLHDSNALLSLSENLDQPMVVIVINNGGGTIFQMLPIHKMMEKSGRQEIFKDFFATPQQASVEHLAMAHNLDYRAISSLKELESLQINSIEHHTVIECVTDASASMNLRTELWGG
jgi:2-succinyl-5-enolpyruvyl-6-hydroxy-3-cyclohexene-1-carboxylate synthase